MWQTQGLYSEYVLRSPLILNGRETVRSLYNYPSERIALIHGSSFSDEELFRSTFKKKDIRFLSRSWQGEPDLEGIKGTLKELETYRPDTIIAFGGGSVIDGAKLCRLFYEVPYYDGHKIDGSLLKTKFIVIPTTIGSGAEVSSAAVYIKDGKKQMIVLHELQPDVIVYDEEYVKKMPGLLLCESALDAFAHLLEGYVSIINNSLIELKAEEGLRLLKNELDHYLNDEEIDYTRLQYAGYLGGIVQNHCIVGAAHGLAHQLSIYDYSHGEAIALVLGAVIRMNSKDLNVKDKYKKIAQDCGFVDMKEMISFIDKINIKAGISTRKAELGKLLSEKIDDKEFMDNIRNDRGAKGNPVEMNDEYLIDLFRSIGDE